MLPSNGVMFTVFMRRVHVNDRLLWFSQRLRSRQFLKVHVHNFPKTHKIHLKAALVIPNYEPLFPLSAQVIYTHFNDVHKDQLSPHEAPSHCQSPHLDIPMKTVSTRGSYHWGKKWYSEHPM